MKEKCKDCNIRKAYAKYFDMHFDYKDCPIECIYNSLDKEMEKE